MKNREDENTSNENPKRKRGYTISDKRIKAALISFLGIGLIVLFLLSPIFTVEKVNLTGNLEDDAQKKAAAVCNKQKGKNIFTMDVEALREEILEIGRIESVTVNRDIPSAVNVSVVGKSECAYIKLKSGYVGIGSDGRILIISPKNLLKVPVIEGVKLKDPHQGQFIMVDSSKPGEVSELISKILAESQKQEIIADIKSIDLSDTKDIHLTLTSDILVNLGEDGDSADNTIEFKIAYLKAIIPNMGSQKGGVIELADTHNVTSRAA